MKESRLSFGLAAADVFLFTAALVVFAPAISARIAAAQGIIPPSAGPVGANAVSVVTGKPYEAERIMHMRRSLADGTVSTHDDPIQEARDSSGRILEDVETDLPAVAGHAPVHLVLDSLFDPTARTVLTWNSLSRTGNLIHLPPKPILNGQLPPMPNEGAVLLGHRMIHGLLCTGYSVQKTIPAGTMGNAAPITTRHEWWIDDDLHVKALEILDDPQHGERTNELISIELGEPNAARFHLPSGYTVREINAPGTGNGAARAGETLDLAHAPDISRNDAIAMLASPDRPTQMQGAAALVKAAQASDDPAVKDNAAYRLARANVGLSEALPLANAAVASAEHDCAGQTVPAAQRAQFSSEIALARYWDTLGTIYGLEGDSETARSYMGSAWKLDPHAYYGSHLARVLEKSGDTADAIAIYRAALEAPGGDELKGTIRERLVALAGDSGNPPSAADEEIPDAGKLAGSAFFDVVYFSSTKSPTVEFVNGAEPLRALIPAIAEQTKAGFTLPDAGPERVVRRVEVICGAQAGASRGCQLRTLGAHEARELLSGNK